MKTAVKVLGILALTGATAWAQGVRKDDIARDGNGAPLLIKTARVCTPGALGVPCNPTALIFDNIQLSGNPINNSQVTTGSTDGRYIFYATAGRYLIQLLDPVSGVELQRYPDVVLAYDASGPSPWVDVTSAACGAVCDGVINDLPSLSRR